MKAIVCKRYGAPDVLKFVEVGKPIPREGEVLVRIHAASLNAADLENLAGIPFVRILSPFRPRHRILGSDIAGVVEHVGKDTTRFKPGDEVIGDLFESGMGGFAEYVCVHERALVSKPRDLSFEEAATLPQAGIIALQGVRHIQDAPTGQKVLINGAGGGMGTFAIQIAKHYEAEIWGVDRIDKFDVMRELGVNHTIDYKTEDFTENREKYDLILDLAAFHSLSDCMRSLNDGGTYLAVGGKTSVVLKAGLGSSKLTKGTDKNLKLLMWKQYVEEDFGQLIKLIRDKKVKPVIDKRYGLGETKEAMRYLRNGHAIGKVVLNVI